MGVEEKATGNEEKGGGKDHSKNHSFRIDVFLIGKAKPGRRRSL